MGGKTLHGEPFDLWEVIALGKKQIFLFHYLIRGPLMKISAQEQGKSTSLLWCGEGKKKKKKLASGSIVAGNELPHEYSSLNKM